jgi:transcriptional regulator with XRE-family HTH domain
MSTGAEALAQRIGDRVREARAEHGWSLDRLALESGVSRRMLVNVEQGVTNASIATLLRLSDALGIGLPALVDPGTPSPLRVRRAADAEPVWRGAGGGRALLSAGTDPPDVVELWDWTLGPGEEFVSEPHQRGTHELLLVLQGTVRLRAGDDEATLAVGDSAAFPGDQAHSYLNPDRRRSARFALTVHEPGVGTETRP